jgi:hypothetical protein
MAVNPGSPGDQLLHQFEGKPGILVSLPRESEDDIHIHPETGFPGKPDSPSDIFHRMPPMAKVQDFLAAGLGADDKVIVIAVFFDEPQGFRSDMFRPDFRRKSAKIDSAFFLDHFPDGTQQLFNPLQMDLSVAGTIRQGAGSAESDIHPSFGLHGFQQFTDILHRTMPEIGFMQIGALAVFTGIDTAPGNLDRVKLPVSGAVERVMVQVHRVGPA